LWISREEEMNPAEDKKTLLEENEDYAPSTLPSSVNVCTVSVAIRMHSGDVEVRGMICGLGELEKMITNVFFECGNCGAMNELQTYSRPRFPYEVDYTNSTRVTRCINCNKKFGNKYDVKVKNAVNIELQDLDNFNDLERLSVVLLDDDTKNISIGEQVVIVGLIEKIRKRGKILPFLFATSIEYENREELVMTEQDMKEIQTFANNCGNRNGKNVIDALVFKFAPSVVGYEHVKKGLLLCAANTGNDHLSKKLRKNSLLIGETGLAKSMLLRESVALVPNSRYTSTLNSSVKSLIAIISKEDDKNMMRLGPVPIASGAICAINEIGRMAYEDQGAFLDAMQEGKIPFSKYGFNMTLNGSATFIMSANPTHDSTWRHTEKIDLSEIPVIMPLLDRIDLIFIFRITRDREAIATYAFKKTESYMLKDSIAEQQEANKESDFLKKYILYTKRFNPRLTQETGSMLCEYYIDVATRFGSPRVLDALFRISYAIARLKQKEVIDSEDAKEAIEFYNVQLQQQSEAVIIPRDPQELASEEIINTLRNSECPYDFIQLVKEVCRKNEAVSRYIGSDFSVQTNKKFRNLRDKFKEGKEANIAIVNQRPLVLAWRSYSLSSSSYYDHSDNTNLGDDLRYTIIPVINNICYSQLFLETKSGTRVANITRNRKCL
jgi:replicative DNA helicase Mcm